ncbi:PREDICTED: cyclin-dependent kinase inhibitor 2-like [Tarenaya hassleriana]|uniref:cyclin-dependent kinase inhibitor 2-like n=1 Tax=Tarenaya hassleriana TaxID=28532 RepID=UPI00053C6422|nr:PREDICTED: cyclin-dependent kinase inhibitor 2-like [Tarenaya hassleriana]
MDMAAPEMDVRGRTRERDASGDEATTETPAVKRRKVEKAAGGESRITSSPCVQLANSGGFVPNDLAEQQDTSVVGRNSSASDRCQSPSTEDNLGGASISCCSSNGFSEKRNGSIEFVDLEEDNVAETGMSRHYSCSTRNRTSFFCEHREELNSMDSDADGEIQAAEAAESCRRSTGTETELEDFFMTAEKDIRKKIFECSRKYNFDFVKEEAMDGRYEWVKLKP